MVTEAVWMMLDARVFLLPFDPSPLTSLPTSVTQDSFCGRWRGVMAMVCCVTPTDTMCCQPKCDPDGHLQPQPKCDPDRHHVPLTTWV